MSSDIRVLAFDPAMGITGWCRIDIDLSKPNDYFVSKTGIIKPAQTTAKVAYSERVAMYGKSTVTLDFLQDQVDQLVAENKPVYIAVEDTYLDPHRPQAYASLLTWITAVKLMLMQKYRLNIYLIPTKVAKQAICGYGGSNKKSVQESIIERDDIRFKDKKGVLVLSEHEADAVAVGISFCSEILPKLLAK